MGLSDKFHNASEDAEGKAKQATGKATGNEQMETEGRIGQVKADLKKATEKVKDAFKR